MGIVLIKKRKRKDQRKEGRKVERKEKKEGLPGDLGRHRPWGLDPACPKEVAEASWSCLQKEFKDTRTTQWMGDTSGKLIEAKSTLLRH